MRPGQSRAPQFAITENNAGDSVILPDVFSDSAKITPPYQEGSILEIDGMTRSGPFYHVARIKGDDYESLQPGKMYRMTIYPVYPRNYPFPSYYVYIKDVQ